MPEKIKKPKSRVAVAKSQLKKGVRLNKRFVFDAEGKAIDVRHYVQAVRNKIFLFGILVVLLLAKIRPT